MSDWSFSLGKYNVNDLSIKQLLEVLNHLKQISTPKEILGDLHFLYVFSLSGKGSTEHLLNGEVIPMLSNIFMANDDENVKVGVVSLLTVLALKNGKFNQSLVVDTSVTMLSNLLETVDDKSSIQIIEAISQQLQNTSGSKSFLVSVGLVERVTKLLESKKIPDMVKVNILAVMMNIVSADIRGDSETKVEVAGISSSPTSTSLSFRKAISKLVATISELRKSSNAGLVAMTHGCIHVLDQKYGSSYFEVMGTEECDSGDKVMKIEFDAVSSQIVNVAGEKCVFTQIETIFLKELLKDRIYKMVVKCVSINNWIYLGIVPQDKKDSFSGKAFCGTAGTAALKFFKNSLNSTIIYHGSSGSTDFINSHVVTEGSSISVELNMQAHTLHFSVNGVVLPNFVSNVPSAPMAFAISSNASSALEVISVQRLAKSSAISQGTPLDWG